MPKLPKTGFEKYLVYLKDAIYIIGILVATYGWISTRIKTSALNENQLIMNTRATEKNTQALEKINEYLFTQNQLNGQFIEHINRDTD